MKKTRNIAIPLLLASLLAVSCEKELHKTMKVDFTATMEQPTSGDSKVYLLNEQWIYWEHDDAVSIGSNMSTAAAGAASAAPAVATLSRAGSGDFEAYNAAFTTYDLEEGSVNFLALHPASDNNRIVSSGEGGNSFGTVQISLPSAQPYRNDSTFAKQVLPMVAWYGDGWENEAPNLDFHNLAGIVRLQFYNSTGQSSQITSITLTGDKQLSGMFNVVNYKTFDPHLTAISGSNALTLTMPAEGLEFNNNDLRSFYLVLPALAGMDDATEYNLTVTVNATQGSFTKTLNAPIRRNGITYTRAIGVTAFTPTTTTAVGLVGNGTEDRPFKIYTVADLQYLRNCFDVAGGAPVYVNGQEVTRDTYFRIMRSDIELTTSNWTAGIKQFKGKMTYYSNAAVALHGITNHSSYPLFKTISTEGVVEGLTMKCDGIYYATGQYSPLCDTNRGGKIIDCHVTTPTGKSVTFNGTDFAGICITNRGSGVIEGSSCSVEGTFNCTNFAGICLNNVPYQGSTPTITGCVAASPMSVAGATYAGGICHTNKAKVTDCYTDLHYTTGSTDWGGIVYQNIETGIITHCYVSLSAIIHSDNVGGIVCNNSAVVDYCWSHGELRGTKVGGIAATVSGGELRNCFIDDGLCVFTLLASGSAHYAGGIAAELTGGNIKNCFANLHHIATRDLTGFYGAVVGNMTGGTITNCYAREQNSSSPLFYGSKTGGTLTKNNEKNTCWLVGNTQDGVGRPAGDALGALKDSLVNLSLSTPYQPWVPGPKLSPYTLNGNNN